MQEPIGRRLKMLRTERGMTLQEVEGLTGLVPATISLIERGITRHPYATTVAKLARAYGVPIGDLIDPAPRQQARASVAEVA